MILYFLLFLNILMISAHIAAENQAKQDIIVLSYNLFNLFNSNDSFRNADEAYLPKTVKSKKKRHTSFCNTIESKKYQKLCLGRNWTLEHYKAQEMMTIEVISQIISMESTKGSLPFIACLQEIENPKVAHDLSKKLSMHLGTRSSALMPNLKAFNRKVIRITPAVITNLEAVIPSQYVELINHKEKRLESRKWRPAVLTYLYSPRKNYILQVLCSHLPSQTHEAFNRRYALATINQFFSIRNKTASNFLKIALGDFNTIFQELEWIVTNPNLAKNFQVLNLQGCHACRGSHYHVKHWSWLDLILIENSLVEQNSHIPSIASFSFKVFQPAKILGKKYNPKIFSFKAGVGLSDHLPIFFTIRLPLDL